MYKYIESLQQKSIYIVNVVTFMCTDKKCVHTTNQNLKNEELAATEEVT